MRRALLLAVVVLVAAACGEHTRKVPPSAIALVGSRQVPRAEFDAELAGARQAYAARGRPFPEPGTAAYGRLKDSVVNLLVDRAKLEIAARQARVAVTDMQIDARLREFKRRTFGGDERRFREQLRQTGMTEDDVRGAIRAELLAAALRGVKTTPPKVTYAPGFEPAGEG
jgi:SurA N-terminal domain